jgi:ribosomal protein S8
LFTSLKVVSTPGSRHYLSLSEIKHLILRHKYRLYIVSTSLGVMSAQDAIQKGIGGELLCEVL